MDVRRVIRGARALLETARRLRLGPADRVKYVLSWYLSRPVLRVFAPSRLIVTLPGGAQAVLRPNGVDLRTLADVFERRLYAQSALNVRRVLDLGANIGLATLFIARQTPGAAFACVEPAPGNLQVLAETLRLNRIRGTIIAAAIGTEAGEAELRLGGDATAFSLVPAETDTKVLRVPQITVPDVLSRLGWEEVDLLKIDIEGYEKTLFRSNNAWLARVRQIVGEAHGHVGYGIAQVRADLTPFGFRVEEKSFDSRYGLTIFEAVRER